MGLQTAVTVETDLLSCGAIFDLSRVQERVLCV